jgi:hypothetical protein|tara:strand:+ start:41 stop:220 length:180 start_codon:yes stop_codon:yes gene_type:complete
MNVVKIDPNLKKRVLSLISKEKYKFDYPNSKNFVDKAVLKLLKELEENGKKKRRYKNNG